MVAIIENARTREPSIPGPALPEDSPPTVIERRPGWHLIDFNEIWRYRELLYFLIWRDIKVRYKQTVLGVGWSVFKPFLTAFVFSVFIGNRMRASDADVTFLEFVRTVFCGVVPWFFFQQSFPSVASSVMGSTSLLTRVYFPRLIIPLASVGANLLDFAVGFIMLFIVSLLTDTLLLEIGVQFKLPVLLFVVPIIVLLLLALVLGAGTLIAALMVKYHDFHHLMPFLIQMCLFATPAIFFDWKYPHLWQRVLMSLNPLHGIIGNFRRAMMGRELEFDTLAISGGVALLLLVVGCLYYRRAERTFADLV